MSLTPVVQINAIIMLIAVVFVILLASHTLIRAYQTKEKTLYLVFITLSLSITPWLPGVIDYIGWLITSTFVLNDTGYILIGSSLYPIAFLSWLYIYLDLVYQKRKNLIIILAGIFILITDILIIYTLLLPAGTPVKELLPVVNQNQLDHYYQGFILIVAIVISIAVMITGIHLGKRALEAEQKDIKWRGRFLIIGFSLYVFAIVDSVITNQYILIPVRISIMFIFLFLYLGLALPKWMRKRLE
ncbi:MAG: hypothetical protein GF311_03800 [Candidatus Lokiarchaeota archaeon]|nr:hypothetical protein [Candidatus Lokiarchaeota archaeon]